MRRYADQSTSVELRLRLPWDSNTAKGFAGALLLLSLLLLLIGILPQPAEKQKTLPYEVLLTVNFGAGDGTGGNKGNLSPEGIALRQARPAPALSDASKAASHPTRLQRKQANNPDGGKFVAMSTNHPQKQTSTRDTAHAKEQSDGTAEVSRGNHSGRDDGTGRGTHGQGSGAGLGFGDIDWGGGGGAVVVRKVIPTAPEGLSRSTIVKLRFVVSPQGEVVDIRPVIRGAPEAEHAAMRALRQWRFRPLQSNTPVVGLITFRFEVN